MIHVGLPSPTLFRLRLRTQLAASQASRRWDETRAELSKRVSELAHNILPKRTLFRSTVTDAAAPAEQEESLLSQFAIRYDALVDLLCWSAKDGIHDGRDRQYTELRTWLLSHYDTVRPVLMRSMTAIDSDTEPLDEGGKAPRDAFESLFLPASIESLINSFAAIERIQRTRDCLEQCLAEQDSHQ